MAEVPNEEHKDLPLKLAYDFLVEKGFEEQSNEIRESKDKYKSYDTTLRRGKILYLLEQQSLLNEFIDKYWSFGKTEDGKRRLQKYSRIYEAFRSGGEAEEEEKEEERIEKTSFAYENDLRDYLSNNLSVIETGLRLFSKEKDGREGIEYPIDSDNRRVDILAWDKNNIPVVIELKVSRGYEKVIGQSLYYKNKVKELLNVPRVRAIIIAREISPQLRIAANGLADVELFEYKLSIKLEKTN
jgi:hypothetical protein